jgi:hypothetical protein
MITTFSCHYQKNQYYLLYKGVSPLICVLAIIRITNQLTGYISPSHLFINLGYN